jgi:signal transduction histidine kinase
MLSFRMTLLLNKATKLCLISFTISIILFPSQSLFPQADKIVWVEHSINPDKHPLKFISAKSDKDFWAEDGDGSLVHFNNGVWSKYFIPQKAVNYIRYFFPIGHGDFLIGIIDNNYFTHYYRFKDDSFIKYNLVSKIPMEGFLSGFDNNIYVYGDWGLLLRWDEDKFYQIENPIKNHIITASTFNNKIYLGTRGEGIYSYDGSKTENIQTEKGNETDINQLKVINQHLFALNAHGEVYEFVNNTFRINPDLNQEIFYNLNEEPFGFYEINRTLSNEYGAKYIFSSEYDYYNHIEIDSNLILISLLDGKILKSVKQKSNYFWKINYSYQIEGVQKANSVGAAFIQLNDDFLPDLFVLNTNKDLGNKLYINQRRGPYFDYSVNLGKSANNGFRLFTFADLNNDNLLEFIGMNSYEGINRLSVLNSDTQFKFNDEAELYKVDNGDSRNLHRVDINKDGRTDLLLNNYLNSKREKGFIELLTNTNINGQLSRDTSLIQVSSSWNLHSIIADFNNDGLDDIYILTRWGKDKLLINKNGNYIDEYENRFPITNHVHSNLGFAFDYDNDGDLDIILTSDNQLIYFYENINDGYFEDVTDLRFSIHKEFDPELVTSFHLNSGDFNNDGFTDLIFNINRKGESNNYLLKNDSAKSFVDVSDSMFLGNSIVNGTIIADIDNDGDLDIYGYRYGENILWVNNLDDNNYLKLFLRGVVSNTQAIGSKVWIYKAGHLNDPDYLFGYKQLGSDIPSANNLNDIIFHFGVPSENQYDLKIVFPSGKSKILTDVFAGQTIIINEIDGLLALLYPLPSDLIRLFSKREFQFYLITVFISFFILLFGIRIGTNKYHWDARLTFILTVVNLSLFWLLIVLTLDKDYFNKYIVPPSVLLVGVVLPNIVFYYFKKRQERNETTEDSNEKLFQMLFNFSHGEWALKNINGLQLLCQNIPTLKFIDEAFNKQFENRKDRMLKMTLPLIEKIIHLSEIVIIDSTLIGEIQSEANFIKTNLVKVVLDDSVSEIFTIQLLASNLTKLKNHLISLKKIVFAGFSSSPEEVINTIVDELKETLSIENIQIQKYKLYDEERKVLILNYELADILDNSIRNAITVLRNSDEKEIEITLIKKTPKILIEIADNGSGINTEDYEKIFEHGYSSYGGTGHGLFSARKILEKYGGRIFVKESVPFQKTVFTIELNEGTSNETTPFNN